jgi:hypothetical protein
VSTPLLPPGRYRHYKGKDYEVIAIARHSETEEPLVVYRPLYGDFGWWVRPLAMFQETIEYAGRLQPRFQWLGVMGGAEIAPDGGIRPPGLDVK